MWYHIALAKEQYKKRCDVDSSSELHKGQVLVFVMPLSVRARKVGRLLCISFQIKFPIFKGSFTFQMRYQIFAGMEVELWWFETDREVSS